MSSPMSLTITVIGATNLPNVEKSRESSDPYASLEFRSIKHKTKVVSKDNNPQWGEKFDWDLKDQSLAAGESVQVVIKDHEKLGRDRLMAKGSLALRDLQKTPFMEAQVPLTDRNGRKLDAKIMLSLQYTGGPAQAGPGMPSQAAGSGVGGGGGDMADGEDEAEMGGGGGGGGGTTTDVSGNVVGIARMPGKIKASIQNRATSQRHLLGSKPMDVQIRVKVWEARKLEGGSLHPVTRVVCADEVKQTRVKKSTNQPIWNEIFFFNFKQTNPQELLDDFVTLEVCNSKKLRSNALIGLFKLDIGSIFDAPGNSYLQKWLLLTDPRDEVASVKGYLKVSMVILTQGKEAPLDNALPDDDNDVESNLLKPNGIDVVPITLWLKIYGAEDLPQMDSSAFGGIKKIFGASDEQKELVDPFFTFSFAGKKVKTDVVTECNHPEWNKILRVAAKWPSMCEKVKIVMKDWDRLSGDDLIATGYVNLSEISVSGEKGFLPTYGPTYLNLYGAPREFSVITGDVDKLNEGRLEGAAYRGRVLLEMGVTVGTIPTERIADLPQEEILATKPYTRCRKFRLFAAITEATMIQKLDSPVEFEISIGSYGNKFDTTTDPMPSTTPPMNAMFDGCGYYYLPYNDQKPIVVVDCDWENIYFRLEALNMLKAIVRRATSQLEAIHVAKRNKASIKEMAAMVVALLDQVIKDCGVKLPEPEMEKKIGNSLDLQMYNFRISQLEAIADSAYELRENATDVDEAISSIEGYVTTIGDMAHESQNSIPDVIISMITGSDRIAYSRIPPEDILFSENPEGRGLYCGKERTCVLSTPIKAGSERVLPGILRVKFWLGLVKFERDWHTTLGEGAMSVCAESYENQQHLPIVKWTQKGLTRPKYSDSTGEVKLPLERFEAPNGWQWEGEWFINPELSSDLSADSGLKKFMEEVYQNEMRIPMGHWGPSSTEWTDLRGDETIAKEEIELPSGGWIWDSGWRVDVNRGVDEEGWEYCVEATIGGWSATDKSYHMCRRRRFVRHRSRTQVTEKRLKKKKESKLSGEHEMWEYATLWGMKFHAKERKMHMVRRRRWHRNMTAVSPDAPPVFFFDLRDKTKKDKEKDVEKEAKKRYAPRMFLTYPKLHKYQLRAYIYQGRDLFNSDDDEGSDTYARVSFLSQSQDTAFIEDSLCPTWDETLIFDEIRIAGDPQNVHDNPPDVIVELFDKDNVGKDEYMGRSFIKPLVKLDSSDATKPTLMWSSVFRKGELEGELLVSFELLYADGADDLPFYPPKKSASSAERFTVPNGIRPVMQRTGIEILSWGVRNMKTFELLSVSSPQIEFEIGGHVIASTVINDTKKHPNFDEPSLFMDVMIPKEEMYCPPLNVKVRDNRKFGRKPIVATHTITYPAEFKCDPIMDEFTETDSSSIGDVVIDFIEEPELEEDEEHDGDMDLDWWSKYYASMGDRNKAEQYLDNKYDLIKLYNRELEREEQFEGFGDFLTGFDLVRKKKGERGNDGELVGQFKGRLKVYPLPPDVSAPMPKRLFADVPSSGLEDILIRVYIIKAIDLQPKDDNGLSDPYIKIKVGNSKSIVDRDNYKPNTLNPVFGKMFELETTIPVAKDLVVKVLDYDLISKDDEIGHTKIDLEDRFLTASRALCGLPQTYSRSGPNKWRDSMTPKDILVQYCQKNGLKGPFYLVDDKVKVGDEVYSLIEFEQDKPLPVRHLGSNTQRLSLHVLHTFKLVPEHVEIRKLTSKMQPGIDQGKLVMWVDLFPKAYGTPADPIDISQRAPQRYKIRAVVRNVKDVILDETSITGEAMSDIYVKGWVEGGDDDKQRTDIHYRSLDGEGNFNWRFVFEFEYLPAEKCIVMSKKEHFWSLDKTETRLPPRLNLQVWDNDKFSKDDFLGVLELNLERMVPPAKYAKFCDVNQLGGRREEGSGGLMKLPNVVDTDPVEWHSLFQMKRMQGWWPFVSDATGERTLTGKLEMEIELVTDQEADERPAAKARDDPNMNPVLDPPNRPETSFLWFTSPWKTFKFIIWRKFKWYFLIGLILILVLALLVLFIYAVPGYTVKSIMGA